MKIVLEFKTCKIMTKGIKSLIAIAVVAILGLITFFSSYAIVDPGQRGVKVTLGEISPVVVEEGWCWKAPFVTSIITMDIKTIKFERETPVYTKDIQNADISYVLNYNLVSNTVPLLYQKIGRDYEKNILIPVIEGTLKNVIGKWNAQDLVGNREKAREEINLTLRHALAENNYLMVTDFQLIDINYSDVFEKAIESKVTAEQRALEAKNKTVEIEENARQRVISAEAEAKSMEIRAKALERNPKLVEYEAVQKWNGQLPNYMMGSTTPFINLQGK